MESILFRKGNDPNRILLGFTGFYKVLPTSTEFYWILLGFTGFNKVRPTSTEFYWV